MGRYFDENYERLRERLLTMSEMVQRVIAQTFEALARRDAAAARAIVTVDGEIDRLDNEVEELVLKLLALQQPMAFDLRLLVTALKVNNDLERMGDQAVNIAHSVVLMHEHGHHAGLVDFSAMEAAVSGMVTDCMKSFVDGNVELARAVRDRDEQVDQMNHDIIRSLVKHLEQHPEDADQAVSLLLISRNLERMGDLATNIAEDVVYYIEGRIIRHQHEESAGK